jgi:chemotaxis protein MotB
VQKTIFPQKTVEYRLASNIPTGYFRFQIQMTMTKNICLLAASMLLLTLSSCLVSKKKFDEQLALANKYLADKNDCGDKLNKANATIDDLNKQIGDLNDQIQKLKDNNGSLSEKLKKIEQMKDESDKICQQVKERLDAMTNSSAAEKNKLMKDLAEKEKELLAKRDELDKLSQALDERDKKLREMQSLIARKDSAVQALKKKLTDALLGFNNSELSVSVKDGKVYVSMSDKLLFSTGSFSVDARGKEALKKIAEVLNKQTDININIEGHTDNKAYISTTTGPVNSNWDLSVMRASNVTKILVEDDKVDSKRIIPSGRSQYFPVESNESAEGRSKNRRIEVILEPDMKAIFDILNAAQ